MLPLENHPSDIRKRSQRLGIVVAIGTSAPDGVFVELNGFVGNVAENHRAEPAVSDGQGVFQTPLEGVSYHSFSGVASCAWRVKETTATSNRPAVSRLPG